MTASSTAAISASASSGALAVLVSSGAATAASTFNGPAAGTRGAAAFGAFCPGWCPGGVMRRATLTPASRPSGTDSRPVSLARRISSTGSDSAGPLAASTASTVSPGRSRLISPASTHWARSSSNTAARRRPASAIRSPAASPGNRSAPHTPATSTGSPASPRHSSAPASHTADDSMPSSARLASITTSVRSTGRPIPPPPPGAAGCPAVRGPSTGTVPSTGSVSHGWPVSTRSSRSAPATVYSLIT